MMASDKILHVFMGIMTTAAALALTLVNSHFGLGPALALASTLMGVGYEVQ